MRWRKRAKGFLIFQSPLTSNTRPARGGCFGLGRAVAGGLACCFRRQQAYARARATARPWVWRGEELRHAELQLPFVAVVRTDVKPHDVIRSADGEGANLAVYPRRPILADGLEMHRRVLWIFEPQAKLLPRLLANGRRELGKLLTKGAGRGGLHREEWSSRPPTRAGHRPPFGRKRRI